MKVLQSSLPFLPEDAILLSDVLAYSNNDGYIQFFNATGIIYRCLENDKDSLRDLYDKGFEIVNKAKSEEKDKNYAASSYFYTEASDIFLKASKLV